MILASAAIFQYSQRERDYDQGPILWGDGDVMHIAALGNGSLLLFSPQCVALLDRNGTPIPDLQMLVDARPLQLSDGRVVAILAGNSTTFAVIDAVGHAWYRQDEPSVYEPLAASAAANGSVLIAWNDSSAPGSRVVVFSYSRAGARAHVDVGPLSPVRILRPPAEAKTTLAPLQAVLFSDGSAAVYWASNSLVWYAPDGSIRREGVQPFNSTCKGNISIARDGTHAYVTAGGARCKFEILRLDSTGTPDPAFAPDRATFRALGIPVEEPVHVLDIPDNGFVAWNYHRALHFDSSGRRDSNFEIRTEDYHGIGEMVWTGDRLTITSGDSLRRFLPNGSEDRSFRVPLLETRSHKGRVTSTLRGR